MMASFAQQMLRQLFDLPDHENSPNQLSRGELQRAALARAIAPAPDILLLDEPTNHLDLPTIERLEGVLRALNSAIVMISHDRRFLETLSDATVWLEHGVTRRLDKGFAHFEDWRDGHIEEEERKRHKLDRRIEDEEHWLRYGVTARRKRNVRRLDQLRGLREEKRRASARRPQGDVKLDARPARRRASWSSKPSASPRPSANNSLPATCRLSSSAATRSALSGRTAPARPR